MAARAKAKAVARSPKVSLCVLDEQWPPSYLQVYCDAALDGDFDRVVDVMMRIAGVMAGAPMPDDVRPMVEEGARAEERVVLRLRPYATFYTPPRTRPVRGGHQPEPAPHRSERVAPLGRRSWAA